MRIIGLSLLCLLFMGCGQVEPRECSQGKHLVVDWCWFWTAATCEKDRT